MKSTPDGLSINGFGIKSILIRLLVIYIAGSLVVFDFFSTAAPFDEDTHNGKSVAIGPKPRSWVPRVSSDFDIPGGVGYSPENWPFVVWKPVCLIYLKIKGYEKPAQWR